MAVNALLEVIFGVLQSWLLCIVVLTACTLEVVDEVPRYICVLLYICSFLTILQMSRSFPLFFNTKQAWTELQRV